MSVSRRVIYFLQWPLKGFSHFIISYHIYYFRNNLAGSFPLIALNHQCCTFYPVSNILSLLVFWPGHLKQMLVVVAEKQKAISRVGFVRLFCQWQCHDISYLSQGEEISQKPIGGNSASLSWIGETGHSALLTVKWKLEIHSSSHSDLILGPLISARMQTPASQQYKLIWLYPDHCVAQKIIRQWQYHPVVIYQHLTYILIFCKYLQSITTPTTHYI